MRNRSIFITLRWISITLIFLAVGLTALELIRYSRMRSNFPPGMIIAGVPVGGLDQQGAAARLLQTYSAAPVELRYREATIQVKPLVVGYELDTASMIAAADLERLRQPFWSGFWDFLWNRMPVPEEVPLRAVYSEDRLRAFLVDEVAQRYDQPAEAAMPVPGSSYFQPGKVGTVLDIDRAVTLIDRALKSPSARVVNLSFGKITPPRPPFQNLDILLRQKIELSDFDGIIEVYVKDMQSGREIHFAYQNKDLVPPDIAFTAASTMKIPIMVSVFRREGSAISENTRQMLDLMIERSENDPADRMMEAVLSKDTGPLEVTADMEMLGLNDTFLAGYFYPGAQLLRVVSTPANGRADVSTDPDPYNQTTPAEMAQLVEDIYQCSENGGGALAAVFPYQFSQGKCQEMIDLLARNKMGSLLQAGLPEGTRFAHKHGWIIETDGLMHTIGDVGLVYSPGGNYVVSVYMYHPDQLLFPAANTMLAEMSQAIYNYYNLPGE